MGIQVKQFRENVIRPALELLHMESPTAEALMLGTAAQESRMGQYLRQVGGGPALGVFQMEPATYQDIWRNFIETHPEILQLLATRWPVKPPPEQMVTDLLLAAVMCRLHYRRVKAALPQADDLAGLANYWKRYYNTPKGAGTESEFIRNWQQSVEGGK
ncbi:MAG: hypothetical protein HQL93_11725 [Magnetococcales bacterium]|nr:hypothetical protein [Magnetococcales bacterium]